MTEAEKELLDYLVTTEGTQEQRFRSAPHREKLAELLRVVKRERIEALEPGWRDRAKAILRIHVRAEKDWSHIDSQLRGVMTQAERELLIDEVYKESP